METLNNLPVLFFATPKAWNEWLAKNHTRDPGIWVKFAKKTAGVASLTYSEALDGALCYGWIDGQTKSLDADYYLQKFTPRRTKSIWSKRNTEKVALLIKAGKMKPAGQAAIDAAKADGRWERAYDSPRNSVVPPDFQAALEKYPDALAFFGTLNQTNRYAFLWRIQTAKKAETRMKRIELFTRMLKEGKVFH